jgi:hypothetical protein
MRLKMLANAVPLTGPVGDMPIAHAANTTSAGQIVDTSHWISGSSTSGQFNAAKAFAEQKWVSAATKPPATKKSVWARMVVNKRRKVKVDGTSLLDAC